MTDVEFSRHLVQSCSVMCMPLVLFGGESSDCIVRFAVCKRRETIEAAVRKLSGFKLPASL